MKNIFLALVLSLAGSAAFAQSDSEPQVLVDTRTYYAVREIPASYTDASAYFPGGADKWSRYVNSSALLLNAGMEAAKQGLTPGQYLVTVRFNLAPDGSVTDARTVGRAPGFGLEEAALAAVQNSGRWTPALLDGRDPRSPLQLQVRFHVFE